MAGPGRAPSDTGDPASVAYGELPAALFEQVRDKWLARFEARKAHVISRTE